MNEASRELRDHVTRVLAKIAKVDLSVVAGGQKGVGSAGNALHLGDARDSKKCRPIEGGFLCYLFKGVRQVELVDPRRKTFVPLPVEIARVLLGFSLKEAEKPG